MLSTIKSAIGPVLALALIGAVAMFLCAHPELFMIGRGLQ